MTNANIYNLDYVMHYTLLSPTEALSSELITAVGVLSKVAVCCEGVESAIELVPKVWLATFVAGEAFMLANLASSAFNPSCLSILYCFSGNVKQIAGKWELRAFYVQHL